MAMEKYSNSEFLAQILITLSELQEKEGLMSEAIMILEQAKQIYEDHYTVVDKRTCKVKRNIAREIMQSKIIIVEKRFITLQNSKMAKFATRTYASFGFQIM